MDFNRLLVYYINFCHFIIMQRYIIEWKKNWRFPIHSTALKVCNQIWNWINIKSVLIFVLLNINILMKYNMYLKSDKIKTGILPCCNHVSINVWLHQLDSNKKLGENARWELHNDVVLNKSWKQHLTKQQFYNFTILQTIRVRWARYVVHCWRCWNKLIRNLFLWNPT